MHGKSFGGQEERDRARVQDVGYNRWTRYRLKKRWTSKQPVWYRIYLTDLSADACFISQLIVSIVHSLFCVSYWSSFGCLLLYLPVVKKLILSILLTYGDKWTNRWIILLMSTFRYTCDYCANRIQFQTRHLRVTAADRLKTYRVYFKDFLDSTTLPFLPSPSAPIPSLHSPPLLLEVGPLKSSYGSGERCRLPQRGLGRSPSRSLDFGAF